MDAVRTVFAIESQIDELARAIGTDPPELRLQNAVREGGPMLNDRPWPRIGLRDCLEALRARPRRGERGVPPRRSTAISRSRPT